MIALPIIMIVIILAASMKLIKPAKVMLMMRLPTVSIIINIVTSMIMIAIIMKYFNF